MFLNNIIRFWVLLNCIFVNLINRSQAKVTFYEHSNFKGHGLRVSLKGSHCFNFPAEWNDRVSSIKTSNECVIVFEHGRCTGKSTRIAQGTQSHNHLTNIGFNDNISSSKSCSGQPSVGSGGGSGTENDVERAAVEAHNNLRRRHGSPDLVGDSELHRKAQAYAEYLASRNLFKHSGTSGVGENLAANGIKNKADAVRHAIVDQWYGEIKHYDYNRPKYSDATGHFTAVVWKSTRKVGIGIAWNPKKNWWVIVANYSPPGNFLGQFAENVPRPK